VRIRIHPKAVRRNPKNGRAGTLPGFGWAVGVTQPAISKKATISSGPVLTIRSCRISQTPSAATASPRGTPQGRHGGHEPDQADCARQVGALALRAAK
jgi:hypothetical protein